MLELQDFSSQAVAEKAVASLVTLQAAAEAVRCCVAPSAAPAAQVACCKVVGQQLQTVCVVVSVSVACLQAVTFAPALSSATMLIGAILFRL